MANGCVAHPEHIASAIQTMAHIPISTYLRDFELERARLMELIKPWGATDNMAYQETAAFLRDLRHTPYVGTAIAEEAAELMAAPLLNCFKMRRDDYGWIDQTAID